MNLFDKMIKQKVWLFLVVFVFELDKSGSHKYGKGLEDILMSIFKTKIAAHTLKSIHSNDFKLPVLFSISLRQTESENPDEEHGRDRKCAPTAADDQTTDANAA